jgi:hypothetical protein
MVKPPLELFRCGRTADDGQIARDSRFENPAHVRVDLFGSQRSGHILEVHTELRMLGSEPVGVSTNREMTHAS